MHPGSARLLEHFTYAHLPEPLKGISARCAELALRMAEALDSDDPVVQAEVTMGLRRLLEAKKCFTRARVTLEKRRP